MKLTPFTKTDSNKQDQAKIIYAAALEGDTSRVLIERADGKRAFIWFTVEEIKVLAEAISQERKIQDEIKAIEKNTNWDDADTSTSTYWQGQIDALNKVLSDFS